MSTLHDRRSKVPLAIGLCLALLLLIAGFLVRPGVPRLRGPAGDPALIAQVQDLITHGYRLSVVAVDLHDSEQPVRYAHWGGAGAATPYEIGSVTKGVTGLLVADAVERRELRLDQPVGEVLPIDGSRAASIPIEALVTHRGGLPSVPPTAAFLTAPVTARITGTSPYLQDEEDVWRAVRDLDPTAPPDTYSNLGAALAGQAAARRAGLSYPELVRSRLTQPLGMTHTRVQGREPLVQPGHGPGGRPTPPWGMDTMSPAGAIVSTPADMAVLARALLEGRAPGQPAATTALADTDDEAIGYFWVRSPWPAEDGDRAGGTEGEAGAPRTMLWHNGATGGYSSMLALDERRGMALIVLHDLGGLNAGTTQIGSRLLRQRAA